MSYNNINTKAVIGATTGTNLITSVDVNSAELGTASSVRSVRVAGNSGVIFSLQVSRSSNGQFYDFSTNAFSATYSSQSRLTNLSPGSTSIIFPAASGGDTYTIYVWPEPHFNTELSFGKNKLRYTRQIEQVGTDAVITFSTDTSISTVSATTLGASTGSSINSYTQSNAPTVSIVDAQLTVPSSASDYGVKITESLGEDWTSGSWRSNALYWVTTAADHETTSASTHDSGSTSTALVLNNVDDLYIGMHVSVIESGSVTSTMPTITAIDTSTLTVTLSAAQTWASGKDITFRAYGIDLISSAIGINLTLSGDEAVKLSNTPLTLRTNITGNQYTANVITTAGIGIGSSVSCTFVDNTEEEDATSVSAITGSLTVGVITIENGNFTDGGYVGDKINFDTYGNKIYLSGNISITKYPTANQTIYIDISKFLTAGAAS